MDRRRRGEPSPRRDSHEASREGRRYAVDRREERHRTERSRSRSRSRSRERHRSHHPRDERNSLARPPRFRRDAGDQPSSPAPRPLQRAEASQPVDVSNIDPNDEAAIARAMGFGGFDSTKGKHVLGNIAGAVDKKKKLDARQMLHRRKLYDVPLTRQDLEKKQELATDTDGPSGARALGGPLSK